MISGDGIESPNGEKHRAALPDFEALLVQVESHGSGSVPIQTTSSIDEVGSGRSCDDWHSET